jgi:hypothetical protein
MLVRMTHAEWQQIFRQFRLDRFGFTPETLAAQGFEDAAALIELVTFHDIIKHTMSGPILDEGGDAPPGW